MKKELVEAIKTQLDLCGVSIITGEITHSLGGIRKVEELLNATSNRVNFMDAYILTRRIKP